MAILTVQGECEASTPHAHAVNPSASANSIACQALRCTGTTPVASSKGCNLQHLHSCTCRRTPGTCRAGAARRCSHSTANSHSRPQDRRIGSSASLGTSTRMAMWSKAPHANTCSRSCCSLRRCSHGDTGTCRTQYKTARGLCGCRRSPKPCWPSVLRQLLLPQGRRSQPPTAARRIGER